jgi:hypothetical protein
MLLSRHMHVVRTHVHFVENRGRVSGDRNKLDKWGLLQCHCQLVVLEEEEEMTIGILENIMIKRQTGG